jgi:hypothetical protein
MGPAQLWPEEGKGITSVMMVMVVKGRKNQEVKVKPYCKG